MTKKALLATIFALSAIALVCCAGYIEYLSHCYDDDETDDDDDDDGDESYDYDKANEALEEFLKSPVFDE